MSKMIIGNATLITGVITEVNIGEKAVNTVVLVKEWDSEKKKEVENKYNVVFVNNEYIDYTSRFSKFEAKGKDAMIRISEAKDGAYYGNSLNLPGSITKVYYTDSKGEKKTASVYFGRVNSREEGVTKTSSGKEKYSVSIGVYKNVDGDKFTEWTNVSFWNEERNDTATKAAKVLKNGAVAAIRISEPKEYTNPNTGKVSLQASGYSIWVYAFAPKKNTDDGTPKPSEAPTEDTATTVFGEPFDSDDDDDDDDYGF